MSKNFVTGFFKTRAAAEAAMDAILKRGYTRDDISVLMSDATKNKEFAVQTKSHAADGLGIGGAIGGTVGAVLAAIAAVGTTIAIPGLGLFVAGPIAAPRAGSSVCWWAPEFRNTAPRFTTPECAAVASCLESKLRAARKSKDWKRCYRTSALSMCEPNSTTRREPKLGAHPGSLT